MNLSAFLQSRLNVRLFGSFPASFCYDYLQLLGKLYYLVRRREYRLIKRNISDMLCDHPKRLVSRITRQTFKGLFAHYFEKMFSAYRDLEQIQRFMTRKVTIQNSAYLDEARALGRGVILVTAHWGAVEFIPWVLGLAGYPVSVILECQTKHLEHALTERARFVEAELLSCKSGESVFYRALTSLKNNRLLMTECDEVDTWHKRRSRTIDLFGKRLYLDNTLDILAKKSGAPVVGVFLKRVSRSRYTLICEPVATGMDTSVGAFTLWQKYVKQHPEQWYQWKKWREMKVAS